MNLYFLCTPMGKDDVVKLFQSFSLKQLRERLVWANALFDREDKAHYYLQQLVEDLYRRGYRLQFGELEIRSLGRDIIKENVYLWILQAEVEYGVSHTELRLSLDDVMISEADPMALITQAVTIRKSYQSGFKKRSKEVQSTLAGLLGIDPSQLTGED